MERAKRGRKREAEPRRKAPAPEKVLSKKPKKSDEEYAPDPTNSEARPLPSAQTPGDNPIGAIRRWIDRTRYNRMDSPDRRLRVATREAMDSGETQEYATLSLDDWIRMGRPSYPFGSTYIERPGFEGRRMYVSKGPRTQMTTIRPWLGQDGKRYLDTDVQPRQVNQHPNIFFGPVG